MSRLKTLSFAIKERLEEIPELKGRVIVYRRCDIDSEFQKRMGKVSGRCVVVHSISAKNESDSKGSYFTGLYSVSLFGVPVLTSRDAKDSDDFMAEIEAKLHGWWPDSIPSNRAVWLKSESIINDDMKTPDGKTYDVSTLTLRSPKMSLH